MASVPGADLSDVVLVLTEAPLTAADVEHLLDIYRDPDGDGTPDPVAFRVLVPAETERHLLAALLEHVGTGELRKAWQDLTGGRPAPAQAAADAADKLARSVTALHAAGMPAEGEVMADDPLPALRDAIAGGGIREVVVVTYPHAFADTFHADWASRARDALQVPVLHLYAGTSELG
ncbi:hypothetical protein ET495_05700 [Xylanimonas allomyrinae]|uniref:Uncharacterized protein n=1 Tax=Xylanimonas allomyrinae TaxID=2509459 RepID=A0A4P6EM67_9MICO|nr:hypothetical protein [Xylanimonas allomyrinae]QAY62823.1 hypothetical protein ET495_05700 [Xylanimonas allomyrinae]